MSNLHPRRKDPYDWREKVCKSCGMEAASGCCPLHLMICVACKGFGTVSKEAWETLRKELHDRMDNPPNKCCEMCDDYFPHRVGSHSDDRDDEPCYCNLNKCNWPYCPCHVEEHLTH